MAVAGDIPKRARSNVNSWREVKNAIDVLNQRTDAAPGTVHIIQKLGIKIGLEPASLTQVDDQSLLLVSDGEEYRIL